MLITTGITSSTVSQIQLSISRQQKVIMQQEKDKNKEINPDEAYSPIARLIQIGREKSYVTIDDILRYFPKPEQDMEQLDRVFAALLSADIAFLDPSDKEE
jgi:hypothetical protein